MSPAVKTKENTVSLHKMGNCLGGRIVKKYSQKLWGSCLYCPVALWLNAKQWSSKSNTISRQHPLPQAGTLPSTPWAGSLGLIKQLQVQADHDLSRGNFMQQETLCNWTLGTLVLLDVSHADLRPTQKIWKEKHTDPPQRGCLLFKAGTWHMGNVPANCYTLPSSKRELGQFPRIQGLQWQHNFYFLNFFK